MEIAGTKNPVGTGFYALLWIRLDPDLVEAAGVEPIFANPYKSVTCDAVSPRLSPRM